MELPPDIAWCRQAEDRLHRRGQRGVSVSCYYLVARALSYSAEDEAVALYDARRWEALNLDLEDVSSVTDGAAHISRLDLNAEMSWCAETGGGMRGPEVGEGVEGAQGVWEARCDASVPGESAAWPLKAAGCADALAPAPTPGEDTGRAPAQSPGENTGTPSVASLQDGAGGGAGDGGARKEDVRAGGGAAQDGVGGEVGAGPVPTGSWGVGRGGGGGTHGGQGWWVQVSASTGRFHVHASATGSAPLGSFRAEGLASCVRLLQSCNSALTWPRPGPSTPRAYTPTSALAPAAVLSRVQDLLEPSLDLDALVRNSRLVAPGVGEAAMETAAAAAVEAEAEAKMGGGEQEEEGGGGGGEQKEEAAGVNDEAAVGSDMVHRHSHLAQLHSVLHLLHDFVSDFRSISPPPPFYPSLRFVRLRVCAVSDGMHRIVCVCVCVCVCLCVYVCVCACVCLYISQGSGRPPVNT